MTAAAITAKTKAYRAKEAATLDGWGEWGEVKDAMQTSLMWSFMFDPKEGLVAPVTRNWGFGAANQEDGDQTEGLFCWDGSFASYMLSLDALDWSLSNLIQIIKMRTSAGFIPSYSAGTLKSRDRTNPPVTANILHQITRRWGADKTKWVVELTFGKTQSLPRPILPQPFSRKVHASFGLQTICLRGTRGCTPGGGRPRSACSPGAQTLTRTLPTAPTLPSAARAAAALTWRAAWTTGP